MKRGHARLFRRILQKACRVGRYVLPVLFCVVILTGAVGVQSAAAIDVPIIDLCHPSAPVPTTPEEGLTGLLGERPSITTTGSDPQRLWTTGGFAGLGAFSYDTGCKFDPTKIASKADTGVDVFFTQGFLALGDSFTSLADSIDRVAWNPVWISTVMDDFAHRAAATIKVEIWGPMMALGLFVASLLMMTRFRRGDMSGAASSVMWILVVIAVSSFLFIWPTYISKATQEGAALGVSALNNGSEPSSGQTNRIMYAVHYQGYLRRTFGTSSSPVAVKYGPRLLADMRLSWTEMDRVQNDPSARAALEKQKRDDFNKTAARVKSEDPAAYRWLTGEVSQKWTVSIVEAASAAAASFFRLAVDLLMIMTVLLLVLMALTWLIASPYLVLPQGKQMGHRLLDNSVRCIGYVATAAVGSWLFSIYVESVLQPGMSIWWSLLLLLVGTSIAWTLIRPDRKALSIMTAGKVNGGGKLLKMLSGFAMAYLGGKIAGTVAAKVIAREKDEDIHEEIVMERSEDVSATPVPTTWAQPVPAWVTPAAGLPSGQSDIVEGEVISETFDDQQGLPDGSNPYARPMPAGAEPEAPPAGATGGDVVPYQRPTATDPEDEYVPCPWCNGGGCGHCDGDGEVPKWVRDHARGDG